MQKKKALTLKKSTKSTPAHQKKRATEKSTKKHYGAFKSTHYDPCCNLIKVVRGRLLKK